MFFKVKLLLLRGQCFLAWGLADFFYEGPVVNVLNFTDYILMVTVTTTQLCSWNSKAATDYI